MSAITFHTPSGSATLRGSERAWMSEIITRSAIGLLDVGLYGNEIERALPEGHYLRAMRRTGMGDNAAWTRAVETAMHVGDLTLRVGDEDVNMWHVHLNTALVIGNDALILAARIHAQCEIHGWIHGMWREKVADIIEDGRDSGLFREDMGWEGIVTLLRENADEPVVMSYSVNDSFPNPYIVGVNGEEESEAWYDLPAEAQWEQAFAALRAQKGHLELDPEEWYEFRFGNGWDAFKLIERLSENRVAVARNV